jgi:hypothetical protein
VVVSRVIFKYTVPVDDRTHSFELNGPDAVVHVASQTGDTNDGVQMWVEYDRSAFHRGMRHFRVIGTGHPIEQNERYIGTAMCPPFVWHVVEVIT